MIEKILPLLNRVIPAGLAFKGLQKANPRLKKFISSAGIAGYGAEEIMDFLRSQSEKSLEQRVRSGKARPDEEAALREIGYSRQLPMALATGAGALLGALPEGQEDIPMENTPSQNAPRQQKPFLGTPNVPLQLGYDEQRMRQQARGRTLNTPFPNQGQQVISPESVQPQPQETQLPKLHKNLETVIGRMFQNSEPVEDIATHLRENYPWVVRNIEGKLGITFEDYLLNLQHENPEMKPKKKNKKTRTTLLTPLAEEIATDVSPQQGPGLKRLMDLLEQRRKK